MPYKYNTTTTSRKKRLPSGCVFGGIFTFTGIVMAAICAYVAIDTSLFKGKSCPAQAVIIDVAYHGSDMTGTTIVRYSANGQAHTCGLNYTSTSLHKGDTITINYLKTDPRKARYIAGNRFIIILSAVMALVFGGMGAALLLAQRRRKRKTMRLIKTGMMVEADITDISENMYMSMDGRHPIIISCRYTSPEGRVYLFRSSSSWYGSYDITPKKKIKVYIDREDPSFYYVDVDSVVG